MWRKEYDLDVVFDSVVNKLSRDVTVMSVAEEKAVLIVWIESEFSNNVEVFC
jgi:hypothetical protein